MNKLIIASLAFLVVFSASSFAQTSWTSSNNTQERYVAEPYNGYDYELWNQYKAGTATMTLTGDDGTGASAKGGTFTASWTNTCNVLFRSGKKWGQSSTQNHTQIGNMTIDFEATWNSSDDVKYLSVYGWAYFTSQNTPRNFSNQIEYYIIQDRGSYKPCNSRKGTTAVIDGIEYGFYVCDRMNQPMLTGNGNFKQFFSIPEDPSKHRRSGKISISEHFKAWHERGMHMDGPLYEVAMKIESYKCDDGSNNPSNFKGNGSGSVTKNILTIGGSLPSSNSGGSSSSAGPQVSCDYQSSYCGGKEFKDVLSNSVAMPREGECLFIGDFEVIQPSLGSTVAINGLENTCGTEDDWSTCDYNTKPTSVDGGYYVFVKLGSLNEWESNGWQNVVAKAKPNCGTPGSSSSGGNTPILVSPLSKVEFRVSSMNNKSLLVESNSKTTVYLYNIKGKVAQKIEVPAGSSIVKLSVPKGIYIVKKAKSKQTQRIMVK